MRGGQRDEHRTTHLRPRHLYRPAGTSPWQPVARRSLLAIDYRDDIEEASR